MNAAVTQNRPGIPVLDGPQSGSVTLGGRQLIMLGSNNYLGLADHPAVKAAAIDAITHYGVGTCINPCFVQTPVHAALEQELAAFLGVEDALLFASCSAANAGALATLAVEGDLIFSDRMNHASIIDGARLSRARTIVYDYRSAQDLGEKLDRYLPVGDHALIITDGVFSMEGDVAPLAEIVALAEARGATVIVDDSHATGVVGTGGAGSPSLLSLDPGRFLMTGTFSKALAGAPGGFVGGRKDLVARLRTASRSFIFTTGMSVADAAAALAALRLLRGGTEEHARLWANTRRFREGLSQHQVRFESAASPITALLVGGTAKAHAIHQRLLDFGVYIPVMAFPIVAKGDARLRAQPSAALSAGEIRQACDAIGRAFSEIQS